MSLRYPCGIRQGADQFLQAVRRPDGRRTGICSVPVECPAINGHDFRPGAAKSAGRRAGPGRRLSGVWAAPGRRMADIWIVWVVQNLARRPADLLAENA